MTTVVAPSPTPRATAKPAPKPQVKPEKKGPSPLTLALAEAATLLTQPRARRRTGQSSAEYYKAERTRLDRLEALEAVIRAASSDASRECDDGQTRINHGLADYWFGVTVDSKTRTGELKREAASRKPQS